MHSCSSLTVCRTSGTRRKSIWRHFFNDTIPKKPHLISHDYLAHSSGTTESQSEWNVVSCCTISILSSPPWRELRTHPPSCQHHLTADDAEKQKDATHINVNVGVEDVMTVGRVRGGEDEVHRLGIGHLEREHLGILRGEKKATYSNSVTFKVIPMHLTHYMFTVPPI